MSKRFVVKHRNIQCEISNIDPFSFNFSVLKSQAETGTRSRRKPKRPKHFKFFSDRRRFHLCRRFRDKKSWPWLHPWQYYVRVWNSRRAPGDATVNSVDVLVRPKNILLFPETWWKQLGLVGVFFIPLRQLIFYQNVIFRCVQWNRISKNPIKTLGSGQKFRVGQVSGNNNIFFWPKPFKHSVEATVCQFSEN